MIAFGPSSRRASSTRMSSCPTCTPSASAISATSTRSLMTSGTPVPASAALMARASLDHAARRAALVAQLDQRRAARGRKARDLVERTPVRALRIHDRIEPDVDHHADPRPLAISVGVEIVERVEQRDRKAARPARARAGDLAGDAEHGQRRRRRGQRIALDRQAGGDQRRGRAPHRGDARHQRMAVLQRDMARAVGDEIDLAGERDDRQRVERIADELVGLRLSAGERRRTRRG